MVSGSSTLLVHISVNFGIDHLPNKDDILQFLITPKLDGYVVPNAYLSVKIVV